MDFQKAVDAERQELVSLLKALITQDTTNPPGNESMAVDVIRKFFDRHKIRYKIFEKQRGRANIIGYIGNGKPILIVPVHTDVVPAGDGWKTDPFKPTVRSGKIYGRGATDNKGPLACAIIAAKIFKSGEKSMKGSLVIACVADEERGSEYGMKYLLKTRRLSADYAIVPDLENRMGKIAIGEKGLLFLKITSFGKQAHASTPQFGVNAIENMLDFLIEFRRWRYKHTSNVLFSSPTKNLGVITGGLAPNIVPAQCEARLDFRYLPGTKKQDILRDVRKMFAAVKKRNKHAKFGLEVIDDQKPFVEKRKSLLTKSLSKNIKSVAGMTPEIYGSSGTTLAKPLAEAGMITAALGPGDPGTAHTVNEYIRIAELVKFTKVLCMTAEDVLS
jgi:succinyl-diaminopimelate desuccinylase